MLGPRRRRGRTRDTVVLGGAKRGDRKYAKTLYGIKSIATAMIHRCCYSVLPPPPLHLSQGNLLAYSKREYLCCWKYFVCANASIYLHSKSWIRVNELPPTDEPSDSRVSSTDSRA